MMFYNANKYKSKKKEINKKNKSRIFLLLLISLIILFFIVISLSNFNEQDLNRIISKISFLNESVVQEIDLKKLNEREQIFYFAESFGILQSLVRINNRGDWIEIALPINFSAVDLNYTNFRLSNFFGSLNWEQLSGEELSEQNVQVLTFVSPLETKYRFRVFYDRTGAYPESKPKMSIVVKGFGNMSPSEMEKWLNVDKNICYAVIPINRISRINMQSIIQRNYEALIEIPLEDPGHPFVLTPDYAIFGHFRDAEIVRKLDQYFSLLPGAKGTITHRGGLITTDRRIMPIILKYIKDRKMYFIDDKAIETSIAFDFAQQLMLSSFEKSITFNPRFFLTDVNNHRLINELKTINKDPMIVTLQRPDDETFSFLEKLIKVANEIGFEIVRVSEL